MHNQTGLFETEFSGRCDFDGYSMSATVLARDPGWILIRGRCRATLTAH